MTTAFQNVGAIPQDEALSGFFRLLDKKFPEPTLASAEERAAFYQILREIVARRHTADEVKFYEASTLLEEAISRFESRAQGPVGGAREPGATAAVMKWEERSVAWGARLYTQLKTRYGALVAGVTAIIDFLKPVIDFAPLVMLGSAIVGIGSYVAARRSRQSRQRLMTWVYLSILFFVSSGGWLLVTTYVPGAKAGVLAQVVPGAAEIQQKLVKLLAGIAEDTKRTADSAASIDRTLGGLRNDLDPKSQIQKAGYAVDGIGYVNAIADGANEQYLYQSVGIKGRAEDFRAALLTPGRDQRSFDRLSDAIGAYDPPNFIVEVAEDVRKDLRGLRVGSLGNFRASACGLPDTLLAKLAAARLGDRCGDEAVWLDSALQFLTLLANKVRVKDLDIDSLSYTPSDFERVKSEALIDGLSHPAEKARIVSSRVLAAIGRNGIEIFDDAVERQIFVGTMLASSVTGACITTFAGLRPVCEASVSLLLTPDRGARVLSIANAVESPRAWSLRAFVGSARSKSAIVVTRDISDFFLKPAQKSAMLRDNEDRALVRLSCQTQDGGKYPILYFGAGAPVKALAEELFSNNGSTTNDSVFLQFDRDANATKWPTSGAIGRYSHYVTLSDANIVQLKARTSMSLYMGGRKLGTFILRGFGHAVDAVFKSAGC